MANAKVHPDRGSTNGERYEPRQIVKDSAKKARRGQDRKEEVVVAKEDE